MPSNNLVGVRIASAQANAYVTSNDADNALDAAITDVLDITVTGNRTLTSAELRSYQTFRLGGTPGTAFTLTIPSAVKRGIITIVNNTGQAVTVTITGQAPTAPDIAANASGAVSIDGVAVRAVGSGSGGGSGSIAVQEAGVNVVASATTLNFDGTSFNVANVAGVPTVSLGTVGGALDVQEGGTSIVSTASAINFDATSFDVTNVAGVPTVAAASSLGKIAVQEGGTSVVAAANTINFDATSFDVTDVAGVPTIAASSALGKIDVQEGGTSVVTAAGAINFDAAAFNVSNVAGVANIGISSSASGAGIDVREGGVAVVSSALAIDFDAAKFNVTNVAGVPTVTTASALTSGTAQATTSGSTVEWIVPTGTKRITMMFKDVSTSGTAAPLVQLGTSSGYQTTGYLWSASTIGAAVAYTTGFSIFRTGSATNVVSGRMLVCNLDGNDFVADMNLVLTNSNAALFGAGSVTLSAAMDRIRITTTDAFDAGKINILYE